MYIAFFIYSLSAVFSKLAAGSKAFSLHFFLCIFGIFAVLAVYAFLWQIVLKNVQLSVAMSNKPVVLIFGTLWAVLIFNEEIGLKFFAGLFLIILGLFIIGFKNE